MSCRLQLFPHFSTVLSNPTPPASPFLPPLEPHCVIPATSIRITNKLSLTSIYHCTTLSFERRAPPRISYPSLPLPPPPTPSHPSNFLSFSPSNTPSPPPS